jgi:hypothetical protein
MLESEIALLRVAIEERMATCKTPEQILKHTPELIALIRCVEILVKTDHKIESERLKNIDKVFKTAGDLAAELSDIVINVHPDFDVKKVAAELKRRSRRLNK